MRTASERLAALRRGFLAEQAAILLLRLKFYAILDRRYAVKGGEIDIVARRGATIAFVEVKARGEMDRALEAVTPAKRRRLSRAARVWLAAHPQAAVLTLRADAVFFAPWRWPRHLPAAFELDLG
ncbi:YraN family protein [Methylocella sp.]|uniref:YraN family protein n=1 Tax=Methylocella sp. TaxID=1978226 RepID=UPI003784D70D